MAQCSRLWQNSISPQYREWSSQDVRVSFKAKPYQEDDISKPLFNAYLSNCNDTPLSVETTEPGGIYGMSLACCLHTSCLGRFLLSILSHKSNVYGERNPSPSSRQDNSLLSRTVDLHTCHSLVFSIKLFRFFFCTVGTKVIVSVVMCARISIRLSSRNGVSPTSGIFF